MQERYRETNGLLFVNSSAHKPLIPAINHSLFLMSAEGDWNYPPFTHTLTRREPNECGGGLGVLWKKLTQLQVERAWN